MKTSTTLTALTTAVVLSLATACTPDADEPIDAAEVAAPAAVPDPVDPIDAEEAPIGPDHAADDLGIATAGWAAWDTDSDGMLNAEEFRSGFANTEWLNDWDGDDDGLVSEAEFRAIHEGWGDAPGGVDENGLFDLWDADEDGLIDDDELAEGVYATWDQDRNNMIDENEFAAGNSWFDDGY